MFCAKKLVVVFALPPLEIAEQFGGHVAGVLASLCTPVFFVDVSNGVVLVLIWFKDKGRVWGAVELVVWFSD